MPDVPQIPNLPSEVQGMAPGVAGEIAEVNAEAEAVPGDLRVPTAGQEFQELAPEQAAKVAEAQALVADTPELDLPKPNGTRRTRRRSRRLRVAPDLLVTAPPGRRAEGRRGKPELRPHRRRQVARPGEAGEGQGQAAVIVIAVALIGAVVAGVIVLASGGGGKKAATTTTQQTTTGPTTTTTTTPVTPEIGPTALQQQALAPAGSSLVLASPGGAIQPLSADTLKPQASTSDPAGPVGVSQSYGRLYVADRETLTSLRLRIWRRWTP